MLFKRVITALVLAPLIILAVIKLPAGGFALLWGAIILLAAWEWTDLASLQSPVKRILYLLAILSSMLFFYYWKNLLEKIAIQFERGEWLQWSGIMDWWAVPVVGFWLVIGFKMKRAPTKLLDANWSTETKLIIGWVILVFSWMFLQRLDSFWDWHMTLYFLFLIWIADIAAYFCGKYFGKDKLLPEISPGKTIQGLYGAIISAMICGVLLALYYGYPFMIATDFALLSVLTVLISIYGDLFFSLVKRKNGVKDSGTILPGHGGVLDRIDSVIAAAPFYYAGIILIGRGIFS
jgi:phosphatidate cytidylyltransferase